MKIALAHKRLDLAGGTERDFYRTAEGLRNLGHEVHLFCSEFVREKRGRHVVVKILVAEIHLGVEPVQSGCNAAV